GRGARPLAAGRLARAAADDNGTPPEVIDGTTASLYADVLVGDAVVSAVPVAFSVTGAGSLAGANTQTDDFGLANTLYVPPDDGSGISTATATVIVDGKTYTKSLGIAYEPAPPSSPLSIYPGYGGNLLALGDKTQMYAAHNESVTWSATGGTIDEN